MCPHLKTPRGKFIYPVYCAFPFDAWSDFRLGEHGSERYHNDSTGLSNDCDDHGIKSIEEWIKHYKYIRNTTNILIAKRQCSFYMINGDTGRKFAISVEASEYLRKYSNSYGWYHNEIRIRARDEERHPH